MTNANLYELELRIFSEALDTGDDYGLDADDFTTEEFGLLWRVMGECRDSYGGVDYVILGEHLQSRYGLDRAEWLAEAHRGRLGRPELMPAYVRHLQQLRERRTLSETLKGLGARSDLSRDDMISALKGITIRGRFNVEGMPALLKQVIEELDRRFSSDSLPGISTGMPRLDEKTGGWQKSDLTLIAARPAVGKTALMVSLVLSAAQSAKVGIISAEQPGAQITQRLLSQVARVPAWKIRAPKALEEEEWQRITGAAGKIKDSRIEIFDAAAPSMTDIVTAANQIGADILFVDYAQRIKGKGANLYERVSAVAQGLKELARDLNIPVVAMCQINRAGAGSPGLEHLKSSGDLEQEADQVMILTREQDASTALLNLAKNRHGPTGAIDLSFDPLTMRFAELAA